MSNYVKYTEKNVPSRLKVRVIHQREPVWSHEKQDWEFHYNGVTIARLYDRESKRLMSEGVAACKLFTWSGKPVDVPSRKIGRAIAVGRALKNYYLPCLEHTGGVD